jgi:glucokinase
MKYVLGIDFGRTHVKGGIVDRQGNVLYFNELETKFRKGRDVVINNIKKLILKLLKFAKKNKYQISGIGIGFPGPLDIKKGIILGPPNLPGFERVELKKILNDEFKIKVYINNDANCAILGEKWKGAATGLKDVCMLTLGTGIGGGLIINGELYVGANGYGAELGHMSIDKNGKKCGCGNIGCLESYISAMSLMNQAKNINLKVASVKDLFLKAEKDNRLAKKIVNEFIENLSIGIANLVNIFNPEMIILGGGIIKSQGIIMEGILKSVQKRSFDTPFKNVKIRVSKLGDKNAGILGAAKLAIK